jgi:hypothetical protein
MPPVMAISPVRAAITVPAIMAISPVRAITISPIGAIAVEAVIAGPPIIGTIVAVVTVIGSSETIAIAPGRRPAGSGHGCGSNESEEYERLD